MVALKTNLISYWKLDEASGTRFDSHGTNDLTDNNTVLSATGIIGDAADFERDNAEYLSHADNSDLSTGDIDWTFACWVNFESLGATRQGIACKAGTDEEWGIEYRGDFDGNIYFAVESGAFFAGRTVVGAGISLSTATWYFMVVWHDSVADTINFQINNGSVQSAAFSAGTWDSSNPFMIGYSVNGDTSTLDGLMDEAAFWKRVLTSGERTAIYNSGAGLSIDLWDEGSGGFPLLQNGTDKILLQNGTDKLIFQASSGGTFTLTCGTGTYSVTGVNPNTKFGRLAAISIGSYGLTGINTNLEFGRLSMLAVGSYILSGVDCNLEFGRKIITSVGSYTISGVNPNLEFNRIFPLDSGVYNLTGINPNLKFGRVTAITTGSYSLSGINVTLTHSGPGSYNLICGLGTYSVTGVDPTLEFNRIMGLNAGSYSITSIDPNLEFGRKVIAGIGAYGLTGIATTFRHNRLISLITGQYNMTGVSITFSTGKIIILQTGSYSTAGVNIAFPRGYSITIGTGSYIVTGMDVSLTGPAIDILEVVEFVMYLQRVKSFDLRI